jgi:hypothetical protein
MPLATKIQDLAFQNQMTSKILTDSSLHFHIQQCSLKLFPTHSIIIDI